MLGKKNITFDGVVFEFYYGSHSGDYRRVWIANL